MNTVIEKVIHAVCDEPEGRVVRAVYHVEPRVELEEYLWPRLENIPNMFCAQPPMPREALRALWDVNKMFFLTDNVGLVGLDMATPSMPNIHVTWFDRRLRGREPIAMEFCEWASEFLSVPALFTQMPASAKATLAWTKRVGFKVTNWYSASTFNAKGELDDLVELTYRAL